MVEDEYLHWIAHYCDSEEPKFVYWFTDEGNGPSNITCAVCKEELNDSYYPGGVTKTLVPQTI